MRYTQRVPVPRVLTMRELRQGLAAVVDEVSAGGEVFAGPHRKPEVVIMSIRQYEKLALSAEQDAALRSMDMEGRPLTSDEQAALRELVAGRITREEYLRRLLPEYHAQG